jgi:hypothetical protein
MMPGDDGDGDTGARVNAEVDHHAERPRSADHDDVGDRPHDEQVPGEGAGQREDRTGERVRGTGQQQHRRRHVGDDIGEQNAEAEQGRGLGRVRAPRTQQLDGAIRCARALKRVVDDEQSDEEHQELPVDE